MTIQTGALEPIIAGLGLGSIVGRTPLAGGSNVVERILLSGGSSVVLKLYHDELAGPGRDALASGLAAQAGLPVHRYLLVDESRRQLPQRFSVTTYLAGVAAKDLPGHPDIASAYRQMGVALRAMHGVKMAGYGALDAKGVVAPLKNNVEFVRRRVEGGFALFAEQGAPADLAVRLRQIIDARIEAIAGSGDGPVLAHDDLHPGNVLFEGDEAERLTLSGVIDFGNAQAADAVSDLAKCLFCSRHDAPGSEIEIRAGYGPVPHPRPEEALWFYTLLHRVTMWGWLRRIGVLARPNSRTELLDDLREMAHEGEADVLFF